MIEKKTLWAVSTDLEMEPKTVIEEDGKVLASKNAEDKDFDGTMWRVRKFFNTEDEARKYIADEEANIREMVPKVKKFINRMEWRSKLLKRLGIKREDYLGNLAKYSSYNYYPDFREEECYAKKLEAFIRSRTLNIGGWSLPVDGVKRVQWFFHEDGESYEDSSWLAELTMTAGTKVKTNSVADVRLVRTVFGECSGTYFIDNDFDYTNDEED